MPSHERSAESVAVFCPYCRRHTARRHARRTPFERAASLAYVYPYRCEACRRRFHAFRWGRRYRRVERDRRAYERVETSIPATVLVNGHGIQSAVTSLSPGGCSVTTKASLALGDVVRLHIGAGDSPLVVDVATVRSIRAPVIGLEFVRLQTGHARRLTGLLVRLRETVEDRRRARRGPARRPISALTRWLATLGFTALCALLASLIR
jgi:hypothetical protein